MSEAHDRLRKARIAANFKSAAAAARAHAHLDWSVNTYSSNENGNAPFSYAMAQEYAAAFKVRAEWLYAGTGPMRDEQPAEAQGIRIIGSVGASSDGLVIMETAHDRYDYAPVPPGGTLKANALEVRGGSMPGIADEGALLYFEEQVTKPTKDMMGRVVIVETMDGRVLVKRLLRGTDKGLFDLESVVGPTLEDVKIRWAAHITAIIPPIHAQKIIRRWAHAA
ncbi:peptidase S24 [Caulobacter sp. CCNWLY153]|uniref:peptidase S24 n=1 Tax=unclassified Caulobacter TaxID=2648921 RepID=UPI002FF38029